MATDHAIQGDALECSAAQLEKQISWVQHLLSWIPPPKKWLVIKFIPDHCHWRMAKHPYLMSSHVFHAQMDNCIAILQYPIFWVLKNLCLSPRFIHRPQFTGFCRVPWPGRNAMPAVRCWIACTEDTHLHQNSGEEKCATPEIWRSTLQSSYMAGWRSPKKMVMEKSSRNGGLSVATFDCRLCIPYVRVCIPIFACNC